MIEKIIQNYQIETLLGEGGMGVVYKAKDLHLERTVALKMLHQKLSNDSNLLERFRSEALFMAKLNHPNIAVLYNFINHENEFYMVMEYVEGFTLESVLKRVQKLSVSNAVKIVVQGLEGLKHAHQKGILHRDIKPANLMVTPDATVKLMDFGIARATNDMPRLTQANRIVGTLEYMAPELIKGEMPSAQSDIYAMGVLLYELVSGNVPFDSKTDFELMNNIVNQRPRPIAGVAADIEKVLNKALSKNPADRYKTIQIFQDELTKLSKSGPINTQEWVNIAAKPTPAPLPFSPSQPQAASVFITYKKEIMVLAASLLVACSILFWGNSETETPPLTDAQPTIEALQPQSTQPTETISLPAVTTTQTPVAEPITDETIKPAQQKKESVKEVVKDKNPPPPNRNATSPAPTPSKQETPPATTNAPVTVKVAEEPSPVAPARSPRMVNLESGTAVSFRLNESVSSVSAYKRQEVRFSIVNNVTVGNEIVLKKGSTAIGIVTAVRPSEGRKKGLVEIEIFKIDAPNGQKIVMRNAILKEVASSDTDITLNAGKEFVGVTRRDVDISVH